MSMTTQNASSSRTGTTTPARAITSKLSDRSTPSFPSASQSFEPLVKSLFRYRLKYILLLCALSTWFSVNFWIWWQTGGMSRNGVWDMIVQPLRPTTLLYSFLSWMMVALPAIVLRKRSPATSPMKGVKGSLSQTSTRVAFLTYLVSAICALVINLGMVYTNEIGVHGDPRLSLFVKSKKHPHYLNGRLLFLTLSQVATASAFLLRGSLIDRFVYRWTLALNIKNGSAILVLLVAIVTSLVFTSIANSVAMLVFGLARLTLPVLYRIPLLSMPLRPFTTHFLKGPWTISLPLRHIGLICRSWFLGFTTFITWEIAECLFENIVAETSPVSMQSADPNTTLVAGVASTDKVFKFFAYSELKELVLEQSPEAERRRADIFGDQKHSPNLWTFLARESLLLLGNDYQLFLRRGQPPPLRVAPTPIKHNSYATSVVATPTHLLRANIFRSSKSSPGQAALDALAADGPIANAVEAGAEAIHVPELFRTVESKMLSSPIAEETKKNVQNVKGLGSHFRDTISSLARLCVTQLAPEPVKEGYENLVDWWTRERKSKVVDASLPFRELDVTVVEVLSHLTCASLTEDRYGIVQRDIPKILEAFVSYLSAIEEYQLEINALYKPSPQASQSRKGQRDLNIIGVEVQKAQEILGYTADGLKEGISRIVRTFGDKLSAFKFPPRTAQKLQGFLDYC
ncbi:nucleoporin protein Ndc1-Nup [Crassisporium funariophilum]|nr:nucleoporin protein Ndc1-Nup [Crassisporium funariophilum]